MTVARIRSRAGLVVVALALAALVLAATPAGAAAARPGSGTCTLPPTDLCTAYQLRAERWGTLPLTYYVNANGAVPPLGFAQDVQDAFDAWENEVKSSGVEAAYPGDRSRIDFTYAGERVGMPAVRDGVNTVTFESYNGGAGYVDLYTRSRKLVEFDVHLNASGFTWMTDLTCPTHDCGQYDVQNVVTHEAGHVVGLYHVNEESQRLLTMRGGSVTGSYVNEIAKRDLGAGDVLGLRAAYPSL